MNADRRSRTEYGCVRLSAAGTANTSRDRNPSTGVCDCAGLPGEGFWGLRAPGASFACGVCRRDLGGDATAGGIVVHRLIQEGLFLEPRFSLSVVKIPSLVRTADAPPA